VQWQRVPIVSSAVRAKGFMGGEGCQVLRALVVSSHIHQPLLALMGTDVGGLYRTLDAGHTWAVAMVGFHSRGAASIAIDPCNASRVLAVGGNSNPYPQVNGLFLSEDAAGSWQHVLPRDEAHAAMEGPAVAFDPSSCSSDGKAQVAYYSTATDGVWATRDGGVSWRQVGMHVERTVSACLSQAASLCMPPNPSMQLVKFWG